MLSKLRFFLVKSLYLQEELKKKNMKYVDDFLNSSWMVKAKEYLSNPQKISKMLPLLKEYISKEGLSKVKDILCLMYSYIKDVATGEYKNYDTTRLLIILATLIYVVSPLDLVPDFVPGGLIDDATIVGWAFKEAAEELERYRIWKGC